jgi:putative hydrolase of the HAD superfamily
MTTQDLKLKNIKAIFFDIDDTLFPTTEWAKTARKCAVRAMFDSNLHKRINEEHGHITEEDAIEMVEAVSAEFTYNYRVLFYNFLNRINYEKGIKIGDIDSALYVAAAQIEYEKHMLTSMEEYNDVLAVITKLQPRFKLGIITDYGIETQAYKICKLKLHRLLQPKYMFISYMMGVTKQTSKIFTIACKHSGFEPQECAYVGDDPEMDIKPASEAGFLTFRILRANAKNKNKKCLVQPDYTINNLFELLDIFSNNGGEKK